MAGTQNHKDPHHLLDPASPLYQFSWVRERTAFFLFSGELAEELAEFGAYMMMFMMTKEAEQRLRQHT